MAFIESAFYGDETSQRNATKVLRDKILGTSVEVDVNEKLIPPFEVAQKVSITKDEEEEIREKAVSQCGGVDQECVRAAMAQLRATRMIDKQRESNSSATAIKGRRLTVNIIDENNKRRRIVIPDGQTFALENLAVADPTKGFTQLPPISYIQNQAMLIGALIISTTLYVFGVAATYTLFMQKAGFMVALPATIVAIFIPYSGYVMIFLYFMGVSAINTYVGRVQG
jgi:hypothetical protein